MASTENLEPNQKPALEAAVWLWEVQKAQLAQDPHRPRSSIISTRTAAEKFGVPKSTVARQLAALKSGKPFATTGVRTGRPNRLTEVEEQMLSFHTFMLRRERRPVSMRTVQDAVHAILSRRTPPGTPISDSWVVRWLRADRAKARQQALLKRKPALSSAAPVAAEVEDGGEDDNGDDRNGDNEDDNEDSGLEEDALSELKTTDMHLHSGHETSCLTFEPFDSADEQLVDKAVDNPTVESSTTIQST
ncbi:hypothetical protein ONZ43_g618 [Nemania bipapillata]|uniref:Uncharacterized protein n=1 Tax=Nemania bipapillata TaxID=110536 RepID=A0ACC2J7M4_9PEZI|nr:hypothetical protein ONZ43_g618 [Nemania bipapillata]